MVVQVSLSVPDFNPFHYMPRSRIAGSYDSSIFRSFFFFFCCFEEPLYLFHNGCTILHPSNNAQGFLFLYIPINIYLLLFDDKSHFNRYKWQQVCENVLNVANHEKNVIKNCNKILLLSVHSCQAKTQVEYYFCQKFSLFPSVQLSILYLFCYSDSKIFIIPCVEDWSLIYLLTQDMLFLYFPNIMSSMKPALSRCVLNQKANEHIHRFRVFSPVLFSSCYFAF